MYADSTASRATQHRAAMEKHAHAARQVKIAQKTAPQARKAHQTPRFRPWGVVALARRNRPAAQSALRPATV